MQWLLNALRGLRIQPAHMESGPAEPSYNMALIVIDDLRADHVSAYGYPRETTPNLDARLAGEHGASGTLFRNCMSPTGWTLTSCASIITGHYADEHGLIDHNHTFQKPKLGHYLGDAYLRAAFTNNGNLISDYVSPEYLESLGITRKPRKWKAFGWDDGFDTYVWTHREEHLAPFQQVTEFLAERQLQKQEKPYFLFFHTNVVHDYHMDRDYYRDVHDWLGREIHPAFRTFYDGPQAWRNRPPELSLERMTEDVVAKYDAGIRTMDALLHDVLTRIHFDDTIVVVVSDHGEGFEPDVGRVHHCGRLHQDLLHVPLMLWLPPALRQEHPLQNVEERFCSTIDIVPTLLACLGHNTDDLPGRPLFDLSPHRRLDGVDRGYVYWGEDFIRKDYDTCRIHLRARLTYPLKSISVEKNDAVREYAYNLAYDPRERDNLLDRRGREVADLEPVSFIVAVNDWKELEVNLLASPVAGSAKHEWILVDNTDNRAYESISALYHEATRKARHDLLFFFHQDVYLPHGWEENVARALRDLEARDPTWGVIGAVGIIPVQGNGISHKPFRGHWCDPNGYFRLTPLPYEVEALDEQWLGFRRSRGVGFDPALPGFHCYGIDLSLAAREAGHKSYAIDAFVWHKYRDSEGRLITHHADSPKITNRSSDVFMATFTPSAEYVRKKWSQYLPFRTTSWTWT